jgi:hypothetical protein
MMEGEEGTYGEVARSEKRRPAVAGESGRDGLVVLVEGSSREVERLRGTGEGGGNKGLVSHFRLHD